MLTASVISVKYMASTRLPRLELWELSLISLFHTQQQVCFYFKK